MQLLINIIFSIIAFVFVAIPQYSFRRHIVALIISILWVGALFYTTLDSQFLLKHGIKSDAVITNIECKGGSGVYVSFVFPHSPGNFTQSRQWLKNIRCDSYAIGNKAPILYSPHDPSINYFGTPEKNSPAAFAFFLILFYGIMIIGNRFESNRKKYKGK